MLKKLVKIAVILVVVLIVVIGVIFWQINALAKAAIERGGTYALGVPTAVEDIDISLFGGSVKVDALNIANPQGFEAPHLLQNRYFGLEIESGSVFSDTIKVPLIELDGMDVYLEKNKEGQNNFSAILANLEKFKSGEEEQVDQQKEGKKFIVDKIALTNITAHVDLPVVGMQTFKIDRIELNGVTEDNAQGVAMEELAARIMPAIMGNVVEMGKGLGKVPLELAGKLTGELVNVANLLGQSAGAMLGEATGQAAKLAESVLKEGGKVLKGAAEGVGKTVEGVGEGLGKGVGGLGKGVGNLGKGIGGLLGGKKKDDEEEEE